MCAPTASGDCSTLLTSPLLPLSQPWCNIMYVDLANNNLNGRTDFGYDQCWQECCENEQATCVSGTGRTTCSAGCF